jgi:hypothetical protein
MWVKIVLNYLFIMLFIIVGFSNMLKNTQETLGIHGELKGTQCKHHENIRILTNLIVFRNKTIPKNKLKSTLT